MARAVEYQSHAERKLHARTQVVWDKQGKVPLCYFTEVPGLQYQKYVDNTQFGLATKDFILGGAIPHRVIRAPLERLQSVRQRNQSVAVMRRQRRTRHRQGHSFEVH